MDLGAYANIGEDEIEQIVKANGIEVPRLRGYRLMKDEESVDLKTMWTEKDDIECAIDLCVSRPFWNIHPYAKEYSSYTDYIRKLFLSSSEGIRWNRIHGWKRRVLKTYIHNEKKRKLEQYKIWNKYAGRDDILYIHARIGGYNWKSYFHKVVNQPWFLEKVDDSFDSTYCDIYAKINLKP